MTPTKSLPTKRFWGESHPGEPAYPRLLALFHQFRANPHSYKCVSEDGRIYVDYDPFTFILKKNGWLITIWWN